MRTIGNRAGSWTHTEVKKRKSDLPAPSIPAAIQPAFRTGFRWARDAREMQEKRRGDGVFSCPEEGISHETDGIIVGIILVYWMRAALCA